MVFKYDFLWIYIYLWCVKIFLQKHKSQSWPLQCLGGISRVQSWNFKALKQFRQMYLTQFQTVFDLIVKCNPLNCLTQLPNVFELIAKCISLSQSSPFNAKCKVGIGSVIVGKSREAILERRPHLIHQNILVLLKSSHTKFSTPKGVF